MQGSFTRLSYKQTGYFSDLIIDYLDQKPSLSTFYAHPVSVEGMNASLQTRMQYPTNRAVLVQHLKEQYQQVKEHPLVSKNIESLASPQTFTICTAHQPALFTGTLYFVYKILHAVRLAEEMKALHPEKHFVPVYWMGSEDADLDELGKFYLNGEKIEWKTKQTGAVGKMHTKGLDLLINRIEGELSVQPYGKELIAMLREAYLNAPDIQTATFTLLHQLFAAFGLVVIIPDSSQAKKIMQELFRSDLLEHKASGIVSKSIERLSAHYKVQANPREINLFYFKDAIRNRIERQGDHFVVVDTAISFTEAELLQELEQFPERFSPNVILRGLFQEMLLPNIAFVGGGGETAYWLELKDLFEYYKVPFPVLVLRNSFLLVEKKWMEQIRKTGWSLEEIFRSENELITALAKRNRAASLELQNELTQLKTYYEALAQKAGAIDSGLIAHVAALQARAQKPVEELEKKMLRAEKHKYEAEQRQLHQLKEVLFPKNGLQERIENFMPFYAKWGPAFIEMLYQHSLGLEQEFGVWVEE